MYEDFGLAANGFAGAAREAVLLGEAVFLEDVNDLVAAMGETDGVGAPISRKPIASATAIAEVAEALENVEWRLTLLLTGATGAFVNCVERRTPWFRSLQQNRGLQGEEERAGHAGILT